MRQSDQKKNSIDKALTILSAFTPYNQEMGTSEISRRLGLHKATVSRILLTLTRQGFLRQSDRTQKFILGPAVMNLARAVSQSLRTNLVQIAKPYIDDLRDALKETVILELLSGESTFMAYIAEGPRLVRLAGSIGDRVPVHAASGAKAVLAFSPPEVRETLLKVKLRRFTKNTITDRKTLERQLSEIREKGIAFDREEIDEGTSAMAVPIFSHEGVPVAAVVVAGPSKRITENSNGEMLSLLKETAAKISTELYSDGVHSEMEVSGGRRARA